MATSPTLKVEIAFTSEPLDTTPTWVDVTQYVRATSGGAGGVFISRGKGAEIGPFEAGSCKVTLSNRDRRFDPSHAAGPNFGNLIPHKQIRLTATWLAVDYPMFYGWVTGWPQDFGANGKDATVTVEAMDAIGWLANNNLPDDLIYDFANAGGGLEVFLRNADVGGWYDETGNGYTATLSHVDALAGAAPPAAKFGPSIAGGSVSPSVLFSDVSVWTMGKTVGTPDALAYWAAYTDPVLAEFGDSTPHLIMQVGVGTVFVYVDGVLVKSGAGPIADPTTLPLVGFAGTMQDVAVWIGGAVPDPADFYNLSVGLVPESSADRVTRILDDVGWPAAWRDITTNPQAEVGELAYKGSPALAKLQEVERSEQGLLFADKSGNVAFRERFYTVGTTVQQIFSDDGGATALPYSTFGFDYDDRDVINDVIVTTPTTWAKSSDAASILANGLQSKKVDTILTLFEDANNMAAGIVAQGKTATYRVPPITVYPARNSGQWEEVLGMELGQRIQVEITPMKVGSQNVQEVALQQIEWEIVDTNWTLTIGGAPLPGTTADNFWFVIGSSLIGGPDVIGY